MKEPTSTGSNLFPTADTAHSVVTRRGRRFIQQSRALEFVQGLRSMICALFDKIIDIIQHKTTEVFLNVMLHLCDRVDQLVAVRNTRSAPKGSMFPNVLSGNSAFLLSKEFYSIMQDQIQLFQTSFSTRRTPQNEAEFSWLRKEVNPPKSAQRHKFAERELDGCKAKWENSVLFIVGYCIFVEALPSYLCALQQWKLNFLFMVVKRRKKDKHVEICRRSRLSTRASCTLVQSGVWKSSRKGCLETGRE